MQFHIVTLFQEACDAYLSASIVGRTRKEKKIVVKYQNPRDFVENKWGKVDERPYGGGPGMVMTALPVVKAVEKALHVGRRTSHMRKSVIVWFSPSGKQFTNKDADALIKKYSNIVLVCGRYEGIDDRAKKILKNLEGSELVVHKEEEQAENMELGAKSRIKGRIAPVDDSTRREVQMTLFEMKDDKLREELQKLNIEKMTPLEALQKLAEMKKKLLT